MSDLAFNTAKSLQEQNLNPHYVTRLAKVFMKLSSLFSSVSVNVEQFDLGQLESVKQISSQNREKIITVFNSELENVSDLCLKEIGVFLNKLGISMATKGNLI